MSEDQDKNRGPILPISSLAVILAAVGFTIFTPAPFDTPRPTVPAVRESHEKITARLWQDPFRAVVEGVKTSATENPDADDKKPPGTSTPAVGAPAAAQGSSGRMQTVQGRSRWGPNCSREDQKEDAGSMESRIVKRIGKGERVTVLGVMVYGGTFAEETEARMRQRYAALSALGRLGFVPEDPDHIDYATIGCQEGLPPGKIALSNILPFEWLNYKGRLRGKENDSVLLLWLNNDLFQGEPLSKLRHLAAWLGMPYPPAKDDRLLFNVIGPASSITLLEMLQETRKTLPDEFSGTALYSAIATVDDKVFLNDLRMLPWAAKGEGAGTAVVEVIRSKASGLRFERTIGSDRQLAEKLIEELQNRQVDLAKDHVVLISEWDTYYSQSLPETFREAIRKVGKRKAGEANVRGRESERLHRVSYLRGIDGNLPREKEEKKEEPAGSKSNPGEATKKLEQPVGESQYDYLRRLADDLYRFDKGLKGKNECIKAIGVLGNDFYDKFLTLQALRQRFPQAIFFTTDLDARLQHAANLEWTRNLIVASNFALTLRKDSEIDLQGDIPPFRDNYQTSTFFAILKAFAKDGFLEKEKKYLERGPAPLLFEIGHHRAVLLNDPPGDDAQPRRRKAEMPADPRAVIAVFVLAVLLLMFTSFKFRHLVISLVFPWKKLAVTAGIAAAALIVLVFFRVNILNVPSEEPFSLLEGVSIWPTELLRLLALFLCLYYLGNASAMLKKSNNGIGEIFRLGTGERGAGASPFLTRLKQTYCECLEKGPWKSITSVLRGYWGKARYEWDAGDYEKVDGLWAEYVLRDSASYRFRRMVPIILIYLILCPFIVSLSAIPLRPVRGDLSSTIDFIILLATVLAFTILNFYVFDVTRVCRQFIFVASMKSPAWSRDSLAAFDRERRECDEGLLGDWMLMGLIARRTDAVVKLVFYPFVIWVIMYVSRASFFDNWQTPAGLLAVLALGALYAWCSAFSLRNAAEAFRGKIMQRLHDKRIHHLTETRFQEEETRRIESLMQEVKDVREGAFAPVLQHPVLRSFLVPFGGVGGVYLIDLLLKMNV